MKIKWEARWFGCKDLVGGTCEVHHVEPFSSFVSQEDTDVTVQAHVALVLPRQHEIWTPKLNGLNGLVT